MVQLDGNEVTVVNSHHSNKVSDRKALKRGHRRLYEAGALAAGSGKSASVIRAGKGSGLPQFNDALLLIWPENKRMQHQTKGNLIPFALTEIISGSDKYK